MTELTYQEHLPPSQLRAWVRRIWTLRAPPGTIVDPQPIVADGCVELVFHIGDPFLRHATHGSWTTQPAALLVGAVTEPTVVRPAGAADVIGIRLHPWAGGDFLGIPLRELRNQLVPLDDAAPVLSASLRRAILDEEDGPRRRSHLVQELERHARSRPLPDDSVRVAVERVMGGAELPAVAQLASSLGRSTRWIQRAFSETLGLSPKMLARIARVQRALALARTDTLTTWSAIAASSGYFDQSHLVRDFRQLVGCLPSEFDPSRLPITDAFVES
jgi:AraC-like DNA-binding protein